MSDLTKEVETPNQVTQIMLSCISGKYSHMDWGELLYGESKLGEKLPDNKSLIKEFLKECDWEYIKFILEDGQM